MDWYDEGTMTTLRAFWRNTNKSKDKVEAETVPAVAETAVVAPVETQAFDLDIAATILFSTTA